MNEDYIISIIIPCFNVEKFIDRCLDSVTKQTIGLEHMQIILINDASTDSTLEKLKIWEQRFPDTIMLVTYDENLRQGGARNIGLSYATGEYIGFVDSDDWIEVDMYETLIREMQTDEYDIVTGQFIRERENKKQSDFEPEWGGIVTGLYTRNLVLGHEIFFPERMSYEDNYWGPLIRHYAKRVSRIGRVLYHYNVNQNSTVTARNQIAQLDRMKIERMLLDEYKKRGFFQNEKEKMFDEFLERYYLNTWFIIFTRFDEIPNVLPEMIETITFYFPDYKERILKKNFTYRSKLLIGMLLEPENNNVYVVKLNWLRDWLNEQGIEF